MERWFDECRISSLQLDEIGLAFYIREVMRNDCTVNIWDLRDAFGNGVERCIENLRRNGMLKVHENGKMITMKIVAHGDEKRERCREIVRRKRIQERETR